MVPPDGDEQLAQQHTDDRAHGNGQNGGQGLPVRGQRHGGEQNGQADEHHGHIGQHPQHSRASRHPEGPLRLRILPPQSQKRRKHRHIAQQQHHQVQGEEAPEQGGIRAYRLDGSSQQAHRRCHDPADQGRAHGHVVVLPPPGEHGGHVPPLRGVGGGGVDPHGPGDHVAEQRHQEQQGHNAHQHPAGAAGHQGYGVDEAGVHADVPGRHGGPDAEGGEQIDGGDHHAAGDDGLGDLPPGVCHASGIGAYHLKAQEVEDDDGDIRQAVQVEGGQEGPGGHVVDKAVPGHIHDAQHPHRHRQQNLDGGAEVQNDDAVAHRVKGHHRDDPDKGQLDHQGPHRPRLPAQHIPQQLRTHHRQRRHPQGKVDPVVPGGPGAPSGVGPGGVDPVVQAAVPGKGGAQLRGDQPIGQQERQDHEQPPEILAVADGGHRGGGLRHEHHAYDGQHHVRQAEFALLHVSSGPGPP